MLVTHEGAVPTPTLHLLHSEATWTPYNTLPYRTVSRTPSPASLPMTPDSIRSYIPSTQENTAPSQELGEVSTTGWYGASAPAPDNTQTAYAPYAYDQSYATPQSSSITYSPQQYRKSADSTIPVKSEPGGTFSPTSIQSRLPDGRHPRMEPQGEVSYMQPPRTSTEPAAHLPAHIKHEATKPVRPRSSPSSFTPTHTPGSVDYCFMNPLGISTSNEPYYAGPYTGMRPGSPRWNGSALDMPEDLYAPQPRRSYTAIAPHPLAHQQRANVLKRACDDDELSDSPRKRDRSYSSAGPDPNLNDEEKLLLYSKEEKSMSWKQIQKYVEDEVGKSFQIPALQMRYKRLKDRLRKWTEEDIKALHEGVEYWERCKWEIISQKMSECGAHEKWNAKQCEKKWREIAPGPAPYTAFDPHHPQVFAPYSMSPGPVDAPPYMPYLHG